MNPQNRQAMRRRIRNRLLKIIREAEDFIATAQSWNDNRSDVPPMDCEPERVLLQTAKRCLAAFDNGDKDEMDRLNKILVEVATRAADEA